MSRLVATPERYRMIQREPTGGDRRSVRVSATSVGRVMAWHVRECRVGTLADLMEPLDSHAVAELDRAAAVIERILRHAPARAP